MKLDLASTLDRSAMSFFAAVGSAGADSIAAMAANQTVTGGDTLTGYAGGSDTFADVAAVLNGDTIDNRADGDAIDLTNVVSANLQALTLAAAPLGVADGTTNATIKLAGSLSPTDVTATSSDGRGGTLVGFHA